MGSLGMKVDMAGITRNLNVFLYLPSVDVIVAVVYRFAVVLKLSRAPIWIAHLLCFIPREFASLSVMKFMLVPVSSKARARIGCACLFKTLICAVANRS